MEGGEPCVPPAKNRPRDPREVMRRLLSGRKTLAVPGVFNASTALLAERSGFECLYLSGAALSNSMGLPDLGVTTLSEVAGATGAIASAVPSLPLIVDADTGFGETVNVARTVRDLERAGAAAVQLEDQVMPKRCGHLGGKELAEPEAMAKRLIAARGAVRSGLVLVARTDAAEREGVDGAVERARLYRRAGADVIFPEALRSKSEFSEFAKKVDGPLLANMTEFGKTPYISVSEFSRLGAYKLVIFPVTTFRAAMWAVRRALEELSGSGTQMRLLETMMTRDEFNELIGYSSMESADRATARRASTLAGRKE